MVDFWASVDLLTGAIAAARCWHCPLGLSPEHFARRLELFDATLQHDVSPQVRTP